MDAFDALNHVVNFFTPAIAVSLIAALAAKLMWRAELKGVSWQRLLLWAAGPGCVALLAGLVVFGHDGKMATYAAMVVACAVGLLWAGWGRR
ncbi:MAG TPA: hypothetical protein VFP68_13045 [Burkholderiaceae bacterium]|nr:hypothetical protein [Burkholderiaceae bacterium]